MPDLLKDALDKLELSDDQKKLVEGIQESFNTDYTANLETEKAGVLNKNQELIDKLKAAKDNAVPEGFDMDGYNNYVTNKEQIIADQKKLDDDKLIATENWDKLKNDMNNNHESAIKRLKKDSSVEISSLRSALDLELIENVALKEIEKVNGSQVLLMPHIKSSIQTFQDDNGKYSTKVVDIATGADRMNNDTGNAMTVGELVSEFQANEQFAGAFPLQNKGSNTSVSIHGTNYNSTNNPYDKSGNNYSLTEQAKLNRTNPVLAKTLREAASA